MEVAIGLPTAVPDTEGESILEWARRAEARGFSSLGVIDRLVYPNYEPLIALAAAAGVTERIRLATTILITPYRPNAALLAKQVASIDRLSGGRFVLGVGIGARDDDYEASGMTPKGRGKRLDQQLEEMKRIWGGEKRGYAGAVGPAPVREGGPELIVGGQADAAVKRVARYGDGWIMPGLPPDQFGELARKVDEAWSSEGRSGKPRKLALAYFALGPNASDDAKRSLGHYYAWLGDYADQIVKGAAASEDMVRSYVDAFEEAGCDELFLFPSSADVEQVDLLAGATGVS
jgi:alkanesulfonate monooxygenase SsuD/methylene tetrahydromethanopterin reductase-like flavin-dependent oxidoreductase (luciferase family)